MRTVKSKTLLRRSVLTEIKRAVKQVVFPDDVDPDDWGQYEKGVWEDDKHRWKGADAENEIRSVYSSFLAWARKQMSPKPPTRRRR